MAAEAAGNAPAVQEKPVEAVGNSNRLWYNIKNNIYLNSVFEIGVVFLKSVDSSKKHRGQAMVALLLVGALLLTLVAGLTGCNPQQNGPVTESAASTGSHTEPIDTTGPQETMEDGTEPGGLGE